MIEYNEMSLGDMSMESLIEMRNLRVDEVHNQNRMIWEVESEIKKRMYQDEAREMRVGIYRVMLKPTIRWNKDALKPLLELESIPSDELAKAYTPAHTETITRDVPENWNMTKAKTLKKFGTEVERIFDRAIEYVEGPLVIEEV